ncbi:hypothetical protein BST81_01860 [Leptolyngbya sp. 'hensonii']|uniref:Sll0314/Alr1548 family TPR repeat-containing protein n=1 Tax=Leptolyngbya sp. 'hensonii' TaxID=1922337 RepID=UPI00094F84D5|nr:Sll0314/Alr1548 family TPR repeat-containing protein [Leptolyngbya sp. 'hensonii']OLP20202.1 hypothetical protein BST81_01860 [Leptolyngbya sp. 'hensonii']
MVYSRMLKVISTSGVLVSLLSGTVGFGWLQPALAKDPFRVENARPIGEKTEAAFKAVFEKGDYQTAQKFLRDAEANEPLVYAMRASLAYTAQDLEALRSNAILTRETAERMVATDPVRGNLYQAIGHFMEGAYSLVQEGPVRGTPGALRKLQLVFKYMNAAEKAAPQDPEVNIVRGYMDLMIAVNLPFSHPEQAIQKLEQYAAPRYLADRGIALGYRDLGQYDQALEYVDRALKHNPDQPEANYLKAQILTLKGNQQSNPAFYAAAVPAFQKALKKPDQLPRSLVWQVFFEYCMNQVKVDKKDRQCVALRDQIDLRAGLWGPKSSDMPKI